MCTYFVTQTGITQNLPTPHTPVQTAATDRMWQSNIVHVHCTYVHVQKGKHHLGAYLDNSYSLVLWAAVSTPAQEVGMHKLTQIWWIKLLIPPPSQVLVPWGSSAKTHWSWCTCPPHFVPYLRLHVELLRHVCQIHEQDPNFLIYCNTCSRSFTY